MRSGDVMYFVISMMFMLIWLERRSITRRTLSCSLTSRSFFLAEFEFDVDADDAEAVSVKDSRFLPESFPSSSKSDIVFGDDKELLRDFDVSISISDRTLSIAVWYRPSAPIVDIICLV